MRLPLSSVFKNQSQDYYCKKQTHGDDTPEQGLARLARKDVRVRFQEIYGDLTRRSDQIIGNALRQQSSRGMRLKLTGNPDKQSQHNAILTVPARLPTEPRTTLDPYAHIRFTPS